MNKKYTINWQLIIVVLIAIFILAVSGYGLRQWNRSHRAKKGLEAGLIAYEKGQWLEAARHLGSYIGYIPNSKEIIPILLKYAEAQMNRRPANKGSLNQAIASYRNILRIEKEQSLHGDKFSEASEKLIELYLSSPDLYAEAEIVAARVIEINPSVKNRRLYGHALTAQRKILKAVEVYKTLTEDQPSDILAYEALGVLTQKFPDKVDESPQYWFDQAVRANPSNPLAWICRADHYTRQNNRPEAIADLKKAQTLDTPQEPLTLLRMTGALIKINNLEKAKFFLLQIQNLEPDNQMLWKMWALLALQGDSKTDMIQVAEEGLIQLAKKPWDFYPLAVELFIYADRGDRAIQCLEQMRQKEIAPALVAFYEGIIDQKNGRDRDALTHWRQAEKLGFKNARLRKAVARASYRLGNLNEAIKQWKNLADDNLTNFDARLNLAKLFAQTKNWAAVEEHARAVTQLLPQNLEGNLLYLQARAHHLLTNEIPNDSSLWNWIDEKLVELVTNSGDSLTVRQHMFSLALQRGQWVKARQILNRLQEEFADGPEVALAEIKLLEVQGTQEQRVAKLRDAIRAFPNTSVFDIMLAQLYDQRDDRRQCEKVLNEAIQNTPNPRDKRQLSLGLARYYIQWDESEQAVQLLHTLEDDFPDDISIKSQMLEMTQVASDEKQAQKIVDTIKKIEGPDGMRWRYEQAKLWFNHAHFQNYQSRIIDLLKKITTENPRDRKANRLLTQTYERAGKIRLAILTYQNFLNLSPNNPEMTTYYITALYKNKENNRADTLLDQALQNNVNHPILQRLDLQRRLREGRQDASTLNLLKNIIEKNPDDLKAALLLAKLKIRQQRFDEAEILLNDLQARAPGDDAVVESLIELYLSQGQNKQALLICDNYVNDSNNVLAYLMRANTLAKMGNMLQAEKDIDHATKIAPNDLRTWLAKSYISAAKGNISDTILALNTAIKLDEKNIQIKKRAIALLLSTADPEGFKLAMSILVQALKIDPEDSDLHLFQARFLTAKKTALADDQAIKILKKVTQKNPNLADAWIMLGGIYLNQNQSSNASSLASRALGHLPNNKKLHLLKARAEYAESPAVAIAIVKYLQELKPNDTDIVLYLADLYLSQSQPNKAIELLKKQMTNFPQNELYQLNVEIALIVALHKNNQKTEAKNMLDALVKDDPQNAQLLLTQNALCIHDKQWK
ncbi:MAG: tetratricopeptide repeat protein, partial [Planctomycetes bacterium]|nr:tetratricopeptide repeat protein [Planctomycetota bacterium]